MWTEATRTFLDGLRHATLVTYNEDGSAHITPVWYLFENDRFHVQTSITDRKARNLLARPRATILVDARRPGEERWVSASGAVTVLTGDESREINRRLASRYLTEEGLADPTVRAAFIDSPNAPIRVTPETVRSWSLREVDEKYLGGILGASPGKWFRPVADSNVPASGIQTTASP